MFLMRSIRHWFCILGSVFVLIFSSSCNQSPSTPSVPEAPGAVAAAREWVEATMTLDSLRADELVCDEARDEFRQALGAGALFMHFTKQTLGETTIELDTDELDMGVVEHSGNTALIAVKGEIRAAVNGMVNSMDFDETWRMRLEEGQWRWCGDIKTVSGYGDTPSSISTISPESTQTISPITVQSAPQEPGHLLFTAREDQSTSLYVMDVNSSEPKYLKLLPEHMQTGQVLDWSSREPWLVIAEGKDQFTMDLFLIRPDGSERRQLTQSPGRDFYPNWSPDGQLIAFTRATDESADIYIIRPDGTDEQQITVSGRDIAPAWSPDGQQIAFASNRVASYPVDLDLYVMAADGSDQRILVNAVDGESLDTDAPPQWSYDGQYIAYGLWVPRSDSSGRQRQYRLVNVKTGIVSPLEIEGEQVRDYPNWSPIDNRLAVSVWNQDADTTIVCVLNVDTGTVTKLKETIVASGFAPSWSPDGKELAFSVYDVVTGMSNDIYITSLNGNDSRKVLSTSDLGLLGWMP